MTATQICPYCAEEIQAAAIVCRYCNRPLPGYEDQVPAPMASYATTAKSHRLRNCLAVVVLLFIVIVGLSVAGLFLYRSGTVKTLMVQIIPTATWTPVPTAEPCYIQAQPFITAIKPVLDDWLDALQLAGSTGRIALSPVVSKLQDIRKEAATIEIPGCARGVKVELLDHMDNSIEGYLLFMSQAEDEEVNQKLDDAAKSLAEFNIDYKTLQNGEPPYN